MVDISFRAAQESGTTPFVDTSAFLVTYYGEVSTVASAGDSSHLTK
jgi:hypothetical protein